MNDMHTLVRHQDIQNWVNSRKGMPAIRRNASDGSDHPRLALRFSHMARQPTTIPGIDDGVSPISWKAWLAELDRQHLALRVSTQSPDFEFVERQDASSHSSDRLN